MRLRMRYQTDTADGMQTRVAKIKYDNEFDEYRVWFWLNGNPLRDVTMYAASPEEAVTKAKTHIGWGQEGVTSSS